MQMRRAHIVPALRAQEVAGRPVDRDGIAGGLYAAKADATLRVGEELAAQVHVGLRGVLVLVEAFGRGVPDIDLRANDRIAHAVAERGVDGQRRSGRGRVYDRTAARRAR